MKAIIFSITVLTVCFTTLYAQNQRPSQSQSQSQNTSLIVYNPTYTVRSNNDVTLDKVEFDSRYTIVTMSHKAQSDRQAIWFLSAGYIQSGNKQYRILQSDIGLDQAHGYTHPRAGNIKTFCLYFEPIINRPQTIDIIEDKITENSFNFYSVATVADIFDLQGNWTSVHPNGMQQCSELIKQNQQYVVRPCDGGVQTIYKKIDNYHYSNGIWTMTIIDPNLLEFSYNGSIEKWVRNDVQANFDLTGDWSTIQPDGGEECSQLKASKNDYIARSCGSLDETLYKRIDAQHYSNGVWTMKIIDQDHLEFSDGKTIERWNRKFTTYEPDLSGYWNEIKADGSRKCAQLTKQNQDYNANYCGVGNTTLYKKIDNTHYSNGTWNMTVIDENTLNFSNTTNSYRWVKDSFSDNIDLTGTWNVTQTYGGQTCGQLTKNNQVYNAKYCGSNSQTVYTKIDSFSYSNGTWTMNIIDNNHLEFVHGRQVEKWSRQ